MDYRTFICVLEHSKPGTKLTICTTLSDATKPISFEKIRGFALVNERTHAHKIMP